MSDSNFISDADGKKNSSFGQDSKAKNKDLNLSKTFKLPDKDRAIKNFNFLTGKFSANTNLFTQSLKSEFKIGQNTNVPPLLKPIVDDFLKITSFKSEDTDQSKILKELEMARRNLANSRSYDELVDNVLSLASLYHEYDYLEEAKLATNLSLGLDPDNITGKELFAKLEKISVLNNPGANHPYQEYIHKDELSDIVNRFDKGKILVVGDLLLDELWEGKPQRISREAPVLILEHVETQHILGGAANTAHNITALSGACHSIGICGNDEYYAILKKQLELNNITHGLILDPSRKTTVKTRVLSKSHSQMQQLLRLDKVDYRPIANEIESKLLDHIEKMATNYDAIVLSDYKGGVISQKIIDLAIRLKREHNKFVIVDAQSNFERFNNVSLITPNQPDTESMLKRKIDDNYTIYEAGRDVLKLTQADSVLITRGEHGMALFESNREIFELPAFNISQVFDVTGAGDTVVATIALALSVGANYKQAMALGNLAAGIVVKKPGTATLNRQELLNSLELLSL